MLRSVYFGKFAAVTEYCSMRRRTFQRLRAVAQNGFHHHVYVVLLDAKAAMNRKILKANPKRDKSKPCVYVGMTGQSPDVRFDKHKAGLKSNRYVKKYGIRLMPELYEAYNPMPYEAALDMEIELAIYLREKGYGVWQG